MSVTSAVPCSLGELLALEARELDLLYRGARAPRLDALRGDHAGRMLAVPALLGPAAAAVRAFAASDWFPWAGKSFRPISEERGEGINRVLGGRFRWFRFETFVGRSRAGDFDAVHLDYDHPGNPLFIRAIEDEIREIAPGLYLGQAYLRVLGAPRLALWFGLARP